MQMQAAALIGTVLGVGANTAAITLFQEPDLSANDIGTGTADGSLHELIEEGVERLLMSQLQKELQCVVRVLLRVMGFFHKPE